MNSLWFSITGFVSDPLGILGIMEWNDGGMEWRMEWNKDRNEMSIFLTFFCIFIHSLVHSIILSK